MKVGPVQFLMTCNVGAALIGLVQGLAVATLLGPAQFGVIGIFVMLGWLCTNFWDIRLADVATKLHMALDNTAAQTRNAAACLGLTLTVALLIAPSTVAIGYFFWPWFTETAPQTDWLIIQGIVLGYIYLSGSATALLRLTGAYYVMGAGKLLGQFIYSILLVMPLWFSRTLDTYYDALLVAGTVNLAIALLLLWWQWHKHFGLMIGGGFIAWSRYAAEWRFLLHTNVMGYTKMLNRGADLLVFSYFADDKATGIYRLAKSLVDGLGAVSEALNNYFFPSFMRELTDKHYPTFQAMARRFILWGGAASLALALLGLPLLAMVNQFLMQDAYAGLALTVSVMLLSCSFVWGVHVWLWPALIHANRTDLMMKWTLIGAVAQISSLAILCATFGPLPWLAGAALLCYYLVAYLPLLWWWHKQKVIS